MDRNAGGAPGSPPLPPVSELITGLADQSPWVAGGFLGSLSDAEVRELSCDDALSAVREWERIAGVIAVGQARALRVVADTITAERGPEAGTLLLDSEIAEEVALALKVSSAAAGAMLGFADALDQLPRVAAALEDGRLTVAHARALADTLVRNDVELPTGVAQRLERELVDEVSEGHVTPGQIRRRVQKRLMALDPEGSQKRRQRARRGRDVSVRPDEWGMAWLSAYLPADVAQTCFGMLDGFARSGCASDPDDARGLGARRADALVDRLLTGHLDGNPPSDAGSVVRPTVSVNVTVPITSLCGLDDEPGELDGFGPLDAEYVRHLAYGESATWRRLLTEPFSGALLDVGTTTYRPPTSLDRFVRLRDQLCRWPGCQVPAARWDLDHTVPYPTGGTEADNLVSLCRRHHRLKTLTGFTTKQARGSWTLITPRGQTVSTRPARYLPLGVAKVPRVLQR